MLEPGESWAVLPRRLENNPNLWSPGVKYGVQPGQLQPHAPSSSARVLGVMRFEKLAEAIDLVNQTGYGLTSGLQSLDDREQQQWLAGIRAGNLYINRTTVGAIVLRQPFGGMGKSAFGPGIKAGGPNYVALLMDFTDVASDAVFPPPEDPLLAVLCDPWQISAGGKVGSGAGPSHVVTAAASYFRSFCEEFGRSHDHFRLIGQDNLRRYLPVRELRVRIHPQDSEFEILARLCTGGQLPAVARRSPPRQVAMRPCCSGWGRSPSRGPARSNSWKSPTRTWRP